MSDQEMSKRQKNSPPPSVDIAVPCYQYGRYLRDCVMSVLTQGHQNLRVLIIDNASTDNSREVAQQLVSEDSRVEVIAHRTNLGQHASYNEAVDWASSKYFTILCADDLLLPGGIARAVGIMEQHPDVSLTYGQAVSLRPQDPMPVFDDAPGGETPSEIIPGENFIEQVCRQSVNLPSGTSAMLVRTDAQKRAGHYRPELPHTDDLEMCLRLALEGSVAEAKAPLAILRVHGENKSLAERDRAFFVWHEEDEAAFDSFFAHEGKDLSNAARLHRIARRYIGERAYWSGLAHLCLGRPHACFGLLRFALKRCPTAAILPPVGSLLRRPDTLRKIGWVGAEMMQWLRVSTRPVRADV